jgi:hypothetical protein
VNENYKWEAERADGTIIASGESLMGCVRFSLIPQLPILPPHSIVGVEMERRFCRGFVRALGGGLKEYVHCVVCKGFRVYVRSNGTVHVTPYDYELYV